MFKLNERPDGVNGLFCVFDKVSKCAAPPFVASNREAAARMIRMEFKKLDDFIKEDYELYEIGWINDRTMEIGSINPRLINMVIDKE